MTPDGSRWTRSSFTVMPRSTSVAPHSTTPTFYGYASTTEVPAEQLTFLSIPAGKTLRIGGALGQDIDIEGTPGLLGQIITNASCNPGGGWGSGFNVNQHPNDSDPGYYALTPHPFYPQLSQAMGGGAVGDVTSYDNSGTSINVLGIGLHQLDCDPPAGSLLCQTPDDHPRMARRKQAPSRPPFSATTGPSSTPSRPTRTISIAPPSSSSATQPAPPTGPTLQPSSASS